MCTVLQSSELKGFIKKDSTIDTASKGIITEGADQCKVVIFVGSTNQNSRISSLGLNPSSESDPLMNLYSV
ncbi:hypothetical protein Y1Q_0016882 [Alligator mississippiensis]|uniref:Uncharacterized protein n=1 Tax=Alligator mississippiensis TaxID=8496 RepID=A0A151P6T4_ALLMI|nr:hypothetical protein Y1Q_0016882 [Alligator mississippiensis]